MAESFNAKIKLFRANLRRVADKNFFSSGLPTYMLILTKFLLSQNFTCVVPKYRSMCCRASW